MRIRNDKGWNIYSKNHSSLGAYIWVWSSEVKLQGNMQVWKSPEHAHCRRRAEHDTAQGSLDRTGETKTGPSRMPIFKELFEEKEPIMTEEKQMRVEGEPGKTAREAK